MTLSPRRRIARKLVLVSCVCAIRLADAATFTVSNTADAGGGSLREAITMANADNTTPRLIDFTVAGTITLTSALPAVTRFMTIDATTAPGYTGTPVVTIDGNSGDFDGLVVNAFFTNNANNKTFVKGLCIINCGMNGGTARNGITLVDGDSVTVTGCFIGINAAGTTAARNTGAGIRCELAVAAIGGTGANNRCVISGNLGAGIDGQTDGSNQGSPITVLNSYIGLGADGMTAVPNGGDGVHAVTSTSAAALTIGDATIAGRNVISANGGVGVRTLRPATIKGNFIGVAVDGATGRGNASHGVSIEASASIVGFGAGAGNVVSANGGDGVRVSSPSTSRSTIRDNFIGTDSTGMLDRGNGMNGVNIFGGGATGGAALGLNVISGNALFGVHVASGDGNITTSKIGINADATAPLGNDGGGVWIDNVPNLTISSCTISGNNGLGMKVSGANADAITITGNAIGLNAPGGGVDFGNASHGIEISGGAEHAIIGSAILDSNVNEIRFNGGNGINADSCNRILFNKIFDNDDDAFGGGGFFNITATVMLTNTQFPDQKDVTIMVDDPLHPSTDETFIVNLNTEAGANAQQPIGSKLLTTDANGHASGTVRLIGPFDTQPVVTVFGVTEATSTPNTSCTSLIEEVAGGPPPTITADTTGNKVSSGNTNDPINTFTGELFGIESVDLELRGPLPLLFARYYASKITADGQITSALGRNRLHNFDAKLTVAGTSATAVLSNGRVVQFTKTGSVWTLSGRADIVFQLVESGGTFLLAEVRTQTLWSFDASGKLTKREDGRGNAHTLSYDGSGRLATVSDGLGRTLTFAYNGAGKLTAVSDGTRTVSFAYTGDDLTSATDALNRTTTYSYDASGNLLSITPPLGNTPVTQTYDASGKIASQTEHPASGDQTTAFAYDAGTRASITDPTTATRVHVHTTTGELNVFSDELAARITIGSDATGRRSTVTDRLGRTTTIAYHAPSGLPASITTADGATTKFVYKARVLRGITFYDLAKITYADGTSRLFTYDVKGNLATSTDQLGEKTKFTYDARGQLLSATDPAHGVATFTYDATTGNLLTSKNSDTGAATYAYDAFSRLVKITYADGTDIDIVYDAADRITSITDERNQLFSFVYDANDNLLTITDPTGMTQYGYDALDRVTQVTDRLLQTVRRTFNSRDQLATVADELNHTLTLGYDSRRRLASITEPVNATVSLGYDAEGGLTSVTDALAHVRHYTRNKLDRLITVSDARGNTAQIERDALQRVTNFIDPIGRQTTWTYDKRGQLIKAGRDGTADAAYVRDAAGRLTKITDPNGSAWSYSYTLAGRMVASKDPFGTATRFAYDTRGRLQKITLPEGGECTIQRDAASNVTGLVFPNNDPNLQFTYDALGRVLTANGVTLTRDAEGQITNSLAGGFNFSATYDAAGRLTSVGYAGAVVITYTYDANDRLTAVTDNVSGAMVGFIYDAAGRLTSVTRSNGVTTTLTYDEADRLTRSQDGAFLDLKYTLDAASDLRATDFTAPLLPAVTAETKQFKYDAAGQLKGSGIAYDARGRLLSMNGQTFTWDGASRLKSIDGTTFTYDGFGDVATRTVAGVTTRFFHHHAIRLHPLVAERIETTLPFTRFYVWTPNGLLLYAIDDARTPSFYHYDRQGSTLALTDGSGTVTDKYAYSPYGELLAQEGPSTQPFRFLGAFGIRTEGALCQVRARYYDPQTARFLSRDPAAPRLSDPRTLDPYLYALGNPLRYVDRDGADPGGNAGYTNFGMWFAMTFVQTHFEEYSPEDDKLGPGGQPREEKFVDTKVEAPVLDGPEVFVERPRKPEFEDFAEVESQAYLAQSLLGAPSEAAGGKVEPGPKSKWAQLVDEAVAHQGLEPIQPEKPFILPPDRPGAIFLEAVFGVPESPSEATRRGLRIPADPPRQKSTPSPTPSATTGVAPDAAAQQAQAVADNALRVPNKATNNELGPLNALKKFIQKAKNKAAVEKEKKKYGVDKILSNNGFPLPKGK